MKSKLSHARRGVLMLVILALLAMFAMVAVAFVVLTSAERRTAEMTRKIEVAYDPPEKILNQAMMVVLRGPQVVVGDLTANPTAALISFSLLEKMYGHETWPMPKSGFDSAPITAVTPMSGGQLIELTLGGPPLEISRRIGSVLTVVGPPNSPVYGLSTRLVGLSPALLADRSIKDDVKRLTKTAHVMAFENGKLPSVGDLVIINGFPYGGMGCGYNPATGVVDLADPTVPSKIGQPSHVSMLPRSRFNWDWTIGLQGGVNTDYTCPDYQDPLLACVMPTPMADGSSGLPLRTIPSLHRPELFKWWAHREAGGSDQWSSLDPKILRAIMFRPIGAGMTNADHPEFTGSNPSVSLTVPWNPKYAHTNTFIPGVSQPDGRMLDVDNDGDGLPDSIWVDLGMPVRWMADGRAYKPLFAILCVDMDGRLNLNAHGSPAHLCHGSGGTAKPAISSNFFGDFDPKETLLTTGQIPQLAGTVAGVLDLPRGMGYGPPEINLLPVLSPTGQRDDPIGMNRYTSILRGYPNFRVTFNSALGARPETGRYGSPPPAPALAQPDFPPIPGSSLTAVAPHTYNKWLDYNGNYWSDTTAGNWKLGAYCTPPDTQGFGRIAFDPAGRPLYLGRLDLPDQPDCWSMGGVIQHTPYDIDLMRTAPHSSTYTPDSPFAAAELERLLRPYDRDALGLPGRLATLLGVPTGTIGLPPAEQWKRCALTTESWAVPTTTAAMSHFGRLDLGRTGDPASPNPSKLDPDRPRHFVDWLRWKKVPMDKWLQMFPPELLSGLRMNINRRFVQVNPALKYPPDNYSAADLNQYDPCGWGDPTGIKGPANKIQAQQWMARYLYCMLTLLRDNYDVQIFFRSGERDTLRGHPNVTSSGPKYEFAQRRLAQFAINAACFSNSDSVMVPFKYPLYPFDLTKPGWCSDNDLSRPLADSEGRQCDVVWGCKPPELIMTEAVAWHNRGTADTAFARSTEGEDKKRTDKKMGEDGKEQDVPADDDLDQVKIPQGTLFVELFCPRSAIHGVAPPDLYGYDAQAKRWYLDLGRMTADGQFPIWRIVVGESTRKNATVNDVHNRLTGTASGLQEGSPASYGSAARPDSCSLEPELYVTLPSGQSIDPMTGAVGVSATGRFSMIRNSSEPNVKIERVISLAPFVAPTPESKAVVYSNRNGARMLYGGQYAVVGPRPQTVLGSKKGSLGTPSPQRIDLAPAASRVTSLAGVTTPYTVANQIRPVLGVVCAASPPTDWSNQGLNIGVNISEPVPLAGLGNFYPEPTCAGSDGNMEWYGDPGQADQNKKFLAHPLEGDPNRTTNPDVMKKAPIVKEGIWKTGTYPNYKTLFLQRIANPGAPYNVVTNPYITVDWLPVDLTVFNGEDRLSKAEWDAKWPKGQGGPNWDPDDPGFDTYKNTNFTSRQRGQQVSRAAGDENYFNVWAPLSEQWPRYSVYDAGLAANAVFPCDLRHTLGFLNEAYWAGTRPGNPPAAFTITNMIGRNDDPYIGDPKLSPFPWITWNGRPFISELELFQVPATSPARLLWEFRPNRPGVDPPSPYYPNADEHLLFPHLLNFFSSTRGDPARRPDTPSPPGAMLLRALDYVGVPSRFTRTDTLMDPEAASAGQGNHWFHPPFNHISAYREPGRINMNTMNCREVLQGLLNYLPGSGDPQFMPGTWRGFVRSRRGTDAPVDDDMANLDYNSGYPTRYARHYGSVTGIELQPVIVTAGPTYSSVCNGGGPQIGIYQPHHEDDQTLVRHSAFTVNEPLFTLDVSADPQKPMHYDWDKNSFCRFQSLQRLANLTTCRSNVYAVWITMGYFEVERWPKGIDEGHPDGWMLGQELGFDSGEVERHRAFYLIDRSIPVGFRRGHDINSDRTVIIKRFIE